MSVDKITTPVIDAVVLWVDGDDPKHKEKILSYSKTDKLDQSSEFRDRFSQINEIKFCIDSLLKFAPFLRKIHIVTDNQVPDFLTKESDKSIYRKVSIVDHKIIFKGYQQYLPTFNCLSIETCMHRIPELAEHFIYFNDDFFLINKTSPKDFFKEDLPILRGRWKKFYTDIFYKRFIKKREGQKYWQQNAARLLDSKKYYRFFHTPHALRKSTFENFFKNNEITFLNNIKYKFRDRNQFTPQGLANHIEIINGTCIFERDLKLMYFRTFQKPILWYMLMFKIKSKCLFLGLQSLNSSPPKTLAYIIHWLTKRTQKHDK